MTDEELIARARELAAVQGAAAVNERFPGWHDETQTVAYVEAFGTAQHLLAELADALDRHSAPEVIVLAWCKRCERGTVSVPCPGCGGPACAGCGRCPPCDGDLPDEED